MAFFRSSLALNGLEKTEESLTGFVVPGFNSVLWKSFCDTMYEGLYFSAAVEDMKGLESLGAAAGGAVAPAPKVALAEDRSGH